MSPTTKPGRTRSKPSRKKPGAPKKKPAAHKKVKAKAPAGLVTRAQAAAELGVEPNRINKWAADGAPVAVRGSRGHSAYYDLEALRTWVAERSRPEQDEGLSLGAARARLATAQAKKYEKENLVRSGQLVERSQVAAEGQAVLGALKAQLLALPRLAVMRAVVLREKEHELRELVVQALRELARWNVGAAGDGGDEGDGDDVDDQDHSAGA